MRVGIVVRYLRQVVLDFCKLTAQTRTEVGQWTARINKRDEQRLAFEVGEVNGLPVLVRQFDVGHFLARSQHLGGRDSLLILPAADVRDAKVIEPILFAVFAW